MEAEKQLEREAGTLAKSAAKPAAKSMAIDAMGTDAQIARLASFPELNPDVIFEMALDGTAEYLNPAARARFPDLEIAGLSHPLAAGVEHLADQEAAGGVTSLNRQIEVDGSIFVQTVTYLPDYGLLRFYSPDVTSRKLAERVLQEGEQRFRDFTETAADWHWELGPDLRFTYLSERIETLTDVRIADVLGKTRQEIGGIPEGSGAWSQHFDDLEARRPFRDFRYRVDLRDGAFEWMETSGKPIYDVAGVFKGYRGTGRVVTPEVEALEAVQESEARYRELVETLNESIALADREHHFEYVNGRFCELLGYSREEVVGRPVVEFLQEDDRVVLERHLAERRAGLSEQYELAWMAKDGRKVHTLVSPRALLDKNGDFRGSLAAFSDITGRKKREAQLRRQAQELARSNAELEQFAYVASHDLQEPLRKVQAFGDRLVSKFGSQLDEQGRDYLDRMQAAAGRMQKLINDLLAFSRVSTKGQAFVRISLNDIVRDVLSDLEVRVEEAAARVDVGVLPALDADPLQMRQLFQNLLGNALKYRRDDTEPHIEITAETIAPETVGGVPRGPGTCRLMVTDNGIGFEQKYIDRIFVIFQRLHGRAQYDGTGVGLAICRKICERHGGIISATSEPGRGSTFVVELPLRQETQERHK